MDATLASSPQPTLALGLIVLVALIIIFMTWPIRAACIAEYSGRPRPRISILGWWLAKLIR